jgi:uncharacterized spore protein YtfJ
MDVQRTIDKANDAMTARRVYGDPYEKNGVTIIPAARVQGGAGGGGGEGPGGQGQGSGSGFAVNARPVGVFVVKGEDVSWRPAIDVNRVIMGGQVVALAAIVVVGWALRRRGRD